uniref:PEST proteolytic signal-containing nuclear protein n=1 Tax=Panagrolaimus superbus TaxID=310955 RepID=A0A914YPY4_9BILA
MASSAYAEDEESEHEKVEAEPVKKWGTATTKKVEEDNSKGEETAVVAPASSKYRPPASRTGGSSRLGGVGMKVDINNEESFPSLAAAAVKVKEEKTKTEEMKTARAEGWHHVQGGANNCQSSSSTSEFYFC